ERLISPPLDPGRCRPRPTMLTLPPEDLVEARALVEEKDADAPSPDTTGIEIADRLVPGPAGAPEVSVRVYRPVDHDGSAVLFLHSGGLILGGLESEHPLCTSIAG